jgi:phospholipid-binding lipoprotein MlaA
MDRGYWGVNMLVRARVFGALVIALTVTGCASEPMPDSVAQNDPYESFNRKVFDFNLAVDNDVALPVAKFYELAVPEPARDGVHNFLTNLNEPATFANDILQGEVTRAGQTLGRFTVNSTIGMAGLVDAATKFGMEDHSTDFGETLAVYGADEGPYLVLPILGPSNPRDAAGDVVNVALDPTTYITFRSSIYWMIGRGTLSLVDTRARNIGTIDEIERSSVDLYATERSLYRQHRNAEIHGGKPDLQNLPNI